MTSEAGRVPVPSSPKAIKKFGVSRIKIKSIFIPNGCYHFKTFLQLHTLWE